MEPLCAVVPSPVADPAEPSSKRFKFATMRLGTGFTLPPACTRACLLQLFCDFTVTRICKLHLCWPASASRTHEPETRNWCVPAEVPTASRSSSSKSERASTCHHDLHTRPLRQTQTHPNLTLHYTTLHYITLHYITLYHILSYYIVI